MQQWRKQHVRGATGQHAALDGSVASNSALCMGSDGWGPRAGVPRLRSRSWRHQLTSGHIAARQAHRLLQQQQSRKHKEAVGCATQLQQVCAQGVHAIVGHQYGHVCSFVIPNICMLQHMWLPCLVLDGRCVRVCGVMGSVL